MPCLTRAAENAKSSRDENCVNETGHSQVQQAILTVMEANPSLGDKDDYLTWLYRAHQDLRDAENEIRKCVLGARALGATWEEIGKELRQSRQAVQQRYGHLRPADYKESLISPDTRL